MPLRARRRFEVLEARIAPSDTLLVLGAAVAASRPESILIAPPKPAAPRQPWTPEQMEVLIPSVTTPKVSNRIAASLDGLTEIESTPELDEALGEMLGPDLPPAEPTSPRPAGPPSLGIGTAPSPAPGSGSSGSAGGSGGGGGGGSPSPSQALTATTDVAHAAAPAPNTSGAMSPMDSGPVAVDDYYQVAHDDVFSDNVLTNDSGTGTVYLDSLPTLGTVSMDSGGGFTYQGGYHNYGTDSFTYHFVDDMTGESSNIATVTIDVLERPPVANPDTYTLQHDQPFHVDALGSTPGVLSNDTDPDPQMETMTATLVTAPANGTLVLYSDGSFDYTPKAGEVGTETFTYKNTDALDESSDATVTLNIIDQKPVAVNDGWLANPLDDTWSVNWNKLDTDTHSITKNVLPNDSDPDGDPLTPILDTPPTNGKFNEQTDPTTGAWTGQFTFTPDAGFGGWVTFTYHVNDGAMNSDPATAKMLVQKLDLDLYDGQGGNEVPDNKEQTRGAYTVANQMNDTNGDGTTDSGQNPVAATDYGRNEVDLMKLVINQPVPMVDPNKIVLVTAGSLDNQGMGAIWSDSIKTTRLDDGSGNYSIRAGDIPAGGKVVYWELPYGSLTKRDYLVSAQYNLLGYDAVYATALWAFISKVEFGQKSGDQIKQEFPDMDPALQDTISDFGGTGLQGPYPNGANNNGNGAGIGNGIVVQWTVFPAQNPGDPLWSQDSVFFDAARRVEVKEWEQRQANQGFFFTSSPYPVQVEEANDDPASANDIDESPEVTIDGHFYHYDRPGKSTVVADNYRDVWRINAMDFLRVNFTHRPTGEGPDGSRCSPYQLWHSFGDYIDVNGSWKTNQNGVNNIDVNNVDLTNPDPTK